MKLYNDQVKANKQAASTVEPSTADTTSNFEFSKGDFVKNLQIVLLASIQGRVVLVLEML